MGRAFQQDKDIRELSWHAEGIRLFPMFLFVEGFFFVLFVGFYLGGILKWWNVGAESPRGSSEALGLLHEAWLGGQRHEGRGQAPQADPGAKAQLRGGQQGLEDADQAEGRAAVGDEVDLVAVGT